MKRILLYLIVLLLLCSCAKKPEKILKEAGYEESDIETILSLSEEHRSLFMDGMNEKALKYLRNKAFTENRLDAYLHFDGSFDTDLLMRLVNEDILNDSNLSKLQTLYGSDGFTERNEKLYLSMLDEYDDVRSMMEIVNTKRYKPLFSDIESVDMSKGDLILVNKYYQLDRDYVPEDLVDIDPSLGRGSIREKVYEAYLDLLEDANKAGYDLYVVSAFRSYDYQAGLYNKYLGMDPKEVVDTYSARPGHSEHQTGMAMDVTLPGVSLDDFGKTDAAKWLASNCSRYGFIIRYPQDKIDITGYIEEPWHIRYLGKEVAQDVYAHKMTYDEYYACFIQ